MEGASSGSGARWLAVAALVLIPTALLGPALFGDQAFVGVATETLSPWRAALDPATRAARLAEQAPITADKTVSCWPLLGLCLERMARGEAPLWNPDNLAGVPLLAQATHGTLHPPNWLALALPMEDAFGWVAWLQLVLAGLFAFALVRELGGRVLAALLGGAAFMLSGYLTARAHWYPITGAALYLPLALLGIERLCRGGRAGAIAITGGALGAAFLTGFLAHAVHIAYACGAWTLVRLVQHLRRGETSVVPGIAWRAIAAVLLGVGLGLPQLGPTLAWVASGDSARSTATPEQLRQVAMAPAGLLGVASADLLGHPRDLAQHVEPNLRVAGTLRRLVHKPVSLAGDAAGTTVPLTNHVESSSHLGAVVLVLAFVGAAWAWRARGLALGLALAGALLAIDTPLLLAVGRLPGLASSDPKRYLLLLELGAALLAAFGLQRVLEGRLPRAAIVATLVSALAVGAAWATLASLDAARWTELVAPPLAERLEVPVAAVAVHADDLDLDRRLLAAAVLRLAVTLALAAGALALAARRPQLGAGLLVALALLELTTAAAREVSTVTDEAVFGPPPDLAALQAETGGRLARLHAGGGLDLTGVPLPPNTGLPFGVVDLCGYWALSPRRTLELLELVEPGSTHLGAGLAAFRDPAAFDHPVLDALAVDRVLSSVPLEHPRLTPAGTIGDAWLYARSGARQRARFAPGVAVRDDAEALERLGAGSGPGAAVIVSPVGDRSPADEVPADAFLFGHAHGPEGDAACARCREAGLTPVTIVSESPEQVVLEVDAPFPGFVVLADTWTSAWTALVDGEPVSVWPADHALRAVHVGAGPHTVTFRYDAGVWSVSLAIGLLALVVLLACALVGWRSGRRARDPLTAG